MRLARGITLIVAGVAAAALYAARAQGPAARDRREWRSYGGGPEQARYSSLKQINRSTVTRLAVAWTWDSGEEGGLQTNPIVVDGVLYTTTPKHRIVALDAATGALKWVFDSKVEGRGPNRGVTYWAGGGDGRIFAAGEHYVYALDARTGVPILSFGREGRIDLRADLGRVVDKQSVHLTTPGVMYRDLLIVGGRVGEGDAASPGYIRAYDARSGMLRWRFHTIPQPGDPGYETWSKNSWTVNGGANNWAGMAVDESRGIVYVPTGSAAPDFHGGDRAGDNLFANTLLALKADTGERIWHFQAVRHDIWDRDFPSPPTLVTVTHGGRRVDAVAQTTKHGYVFLFDRDKGTPLFPIEEREFPSSPVEGEVTARTQPIPTKPAPFARQTLTEDLLTRRTPEARAWALEQFRSFAGGSPFVPLRVGQDTIVFPGFDGGAEWGGSAFDPVSGVLYVNSNDLAWTGSLAPNETRPTGRSLYLKECAVCHRDDFEGTPPMIPSLAGIAARRSPQEMTAVVRKGAGRMPGFPNLSVDGVAAIVEYMRSGGSSSAAHGEEETRTPTSRYRFTGYKKFLDPDGYPATAPPWGTLNAINLNTGEYAWKVPLGEYPELAAKGVKDTGSENYGGPIVTAGGLVFIAATSFDQKFRAFDKDTGALLWETTLPLGGNATPATYEVNGRQFVVIPAGGGRSKSRSGGIYVAFALP